MASPLPFTITDCARDAHELAREVAQLREQLRSCSRCYLEALAQLRRADTNPPVPETDDDDGHNRIP
jgi:hypothetical protein